MLLRPTVMRSSTQTMRVSGTRIRPVGAAVEVEAVLASERSMKSETGNELPACPERGDWADAHCEAPFFDRTINLMSRTLSVSCDLPS